MSRLIISFQDKPLRGDISVPGDKSISHRALLLAALAQGTSEIKNWLPAGDTLATLEVIRSLGIAVRKKKKSDHSWDLIVSGAGLNGLGEPVGTLNCHNAGTCFRLLSGILAGQSFPSHLDGTLQLRKRPMNRIIEPLTRMGARIESDGGRAPLRFEPARLKAIEYEIPVASAQVKSAILLAGLWAEGDSGVHQPGLARDHTERMLESMGAPIEIDGLWIWLRMSEFNSFSSRGSLSLKPLDMIIPEDISSAAFPMVASAIVPGSSITINDLGINHTRTGLLDALAAMGVTQEISQIDETGGEPKARVSLQSTELSSVNIDGQLVVRAIDELPIWAVAATQAKGTSRLRDAAELRVKEVDRIHLLARELGKLGAQVDEIPDGLDITGPVSLRGAEVSSHGDHRLGMALAIAGLVASGTTVVRQADCISDSFPGFVETMQGLGAKIFLD
jgi:3-phosphoshikimate 1-carboxyvinyltransferase